MPSTTPQEKAFDFLREKFNAQETFTKEEFKTATGWPANTFRTYWSKQFLTLLAGTRDGRFRVTEVFRRFDIWEKFQKHVTQKRSVSADYSVSTYHKVMMFEFFMPLTNEAYLRSSLDALFYKDTILKRLKAVDREKLKARFDKIESESEESYLDRVAAWVSHKFGGYSISHVAGRFRAGDLLTIKQVFDRAAQGYGRYLVDETTAIVRFIFPCGNDSVNQEFSAETYFEQLLTEAEADTNHEATRIRWFFFMLFVQSIVEVVNGEDEIWLLESGLQSKLHIWRMGVNNSVEED